MEDLVLTALDKPPYNGGQMTDGLSLLISVVVWDTQRVCSEEGVDLQLHPHEL